MWAYVEQVYKDEEQTPNEPDFTEIDAQKVQATIDTINTLLEDKPVDKKVKQKLKYAAKHWPTNLEKYKDQEAILNGRGSYSKTDPDATFMRMKDDHMRNGQLKAAYNVQAGSNNQYLTHYTLEQTPTDTTTLGHHINTYQSDYNHCLETVTADSGYGSEENYQLLEDAGIEAFVKYNYFHKEQKEKDKPKRPFTPAHLHYNASTDTYYCPMGQAMENIGTHERTTKTGFKQTINRYQAQNCAGCPLHTRCHKSKYNRVIERNENLIRHKSKAKEKLLSEAGIAHRKQRCWDVEAIFGNIKQNKKFTRFMLRGLEKVKIEFGLIALAHNLGKFSLAKAY